MGITQCVQHALTHHPRGRATRFGSRTRSWAEFAARVARCAGGLHSLGIEPGDRIAILALNSDHYLELYAAVPWAGAVVVPLNIRWSPAENLYAVQDSGATVLIIDDAFIAQAPWIRAEASSVRAIVHLGEAATPAGLVSYEHLIEHSAPIPDAGRTGEDLAGIFYTGGTTGFPKGVMLAHRSLVASASAVKDLLPAITREAVFLHAAPMFHIADFASTMLALLLGAENAIIPSFAAERVLSAVEEYQVTDILLVPTMIHLLSAHPKLPTANLTSLKRILYGGSPMPEEVLRQAIGALPRCQFVQLYGQTELSPVATALMPEYHVLEGPRAAKLCSAGRALASCELEVVDVDGRAVPLGTVGEIRVRGANTMLGYWNKPTETAAALRDGWVYTGDAGRLDAEGFVYIVDRIKDMIISGGENVYTVEVESACIEHPAVSQCAVIGIPDDTWGELVHAVVVLKDGAQLSAQDLMAHCHRRIAGYKCPRSVEFRREPLPLTGAGKVLKRALRAPYWEGRSRQVN